MSEFASELVSFAIIDRPFVNTSTGAVTNFNVDLTVESNYAYYPYATDSFTESLE